MHSDDEGRNWTFDRWVLTAEQVCFTEKFNPGGGRMRGQPAGRIGLGSGDFSIFVEPEGEYIYLVYNIVHVNMHTRLWEDCDVYLARTRKRDDGAMGDFVKYCRGEFCEAGNLGRETPIVRGGWHRRIIWSKKHSRYFMTSNHVYPEPVNGTLLAGITDVRSSTDMLNWSEPARIPYADGEFGNHYVAIVADGKDGQPNIVAGDTFSILSNHNGTDVMRYFARFASAE